MCRKTVRQPVKISLNVLRLTPHRRRTGEPPRGARLNSSQQRKTGISADKARLLAESRNISVTEWETSRNRRPRKLFPEKALFCQKTGSSAASEPVTEKSERVSFGKIIRFIRHVLCVN